MEPKSYFSLCILKNNNNKSIFKKVPKNPSNLNDYKGICLEINKIIATKEELEEHELKPLIIYLEHPKLKKIEINNKEEWDILYNLNIINECIINNNKLKISYKIINEKEKEKNTNERLLLS